MERRRDEEERVIRQNDDLREKNLRLQEHRSRSVTRSRSRKSRSSSRRSQSNQRDVRREQPLGNIDENLQVGDNLQDQRDNKSIEYDRYDQPCEHHRRQEGQRNKKCQNAGERYRTHYESDNDEENDPEQGGILLHGREILRDKYAREEEDEINNAIRERMRDERERRRRRREEAEEREIQEAMRQNNHENRLRQEILKRPMRQDLDQNMSEDILKEMVELR
ncbi:trichohyalin-like [Papaver somniferum]|uniref:trichohyalin-like n=1 Tax=Papaver somniferum TaxID=3469 RepID=UPI000E6FA334|nr:trichohyalin-like [Papaver somniferum]